MFLTSPDLNEKKIVHGFFGRKGGVSKGAFASLNCSLGSKDDLDLVQQNRRRVAAALDAEILLGLYQDHTATCITVTEPWTERPVGDAMVTDRPGLALGIITADCGPVLFYGTKAKGQPVIGAAHAGWRGALRGVLDSTVEAMRNLGAENIKAVLGPCIAPQSYEVSAGFEEPFLLQDKDNHIFFQNSSFDLPGYIQSRLKRADVTVSWTGHNTYELEDEYFSYRRACHRGETGGFGQISVIMIKDS